MSNEENSMNSSCSESLAVSSGECLGSMEEKLSKLGARIDEFAAKSAEVKEDAACKLDELNTKRKEAMVRFNEIKEKTPGAWAELKEGFEKSFGDLQKAFEDIKEGSAKAKDKMAS